MARNPKSPISPTKKHLARMERERIQRRNILIGSAVVLGLVALTLLVGFLQSEVLQPRQPVAVVNGDSISTDDYQAQTRYARYTLVSNALNTYQFMQMFGSDPSLQSSFISQLQQIQFQLSPETIGNDVLERMISDLLIRQAAEELGITVTEEEIEKEFQAAFGYFPEGTPTPEPTFEAIPTSTLSPLQQTLVPPTATPTTAVTPTLETEAITPTLETEAEVTPGATEAAEDEDASTAEPAPTVEEPTEPLTPTATLAPTPSPTPFTEEAYQELYNQSIESFRDDIDVTEEDLRYVIEMQILRRKVQEAVVGELERTQEQVWARHILVANEETAQEVLDRMEENGANFCELAAEFSLDESNAATCGDLQWFPRESMVEAFATAAFDLEVGEISEPVESSLGFHIIQVLGHEDRPLSEQQYQAQQEQEFQDWLDERRESGEIEIRDYWADRVPTEPDLPAEIQQVILQGLQQPVLPEEPAIDIPNGEAPVEEAPVEEAPAEESDQ